MKEEYRICYEGEFMAAFNNNSETGYYIADKLNEGGFDVECFTVQKVYRDRVIYLSVTACQVVSIGGQ